MRSEQDIFIFTDTKRNVKVFENRVVCHLINYIFYKYVTCSNKLNYQWFYYDSDIFIFKTG